MVPDVCTVTVMSVLLFVLHVSMVRVCESDGNAGMEDGKGVIVASTGHACVGGTRGSGIVSSTADALGMNVLHLIIPTMYLFMGDIENPDVFVFFCRTWICLDITRLYEEQHQPSSECVCPTSKETVNRPIAGGGRFRHNLHSSLPNRCDSSTTCMPCRLE